MIKAVLAILVAFKLVSNTSSTYQVINFMGDATFYFLPILLANSAAKKLGCNPYLAMMLGGILIHPSFVNLVAASKESGEAITIFMLPIYNASYSSSVIPIILGVLLMSKVEPWATRISPKAIRFFTAPLLTMFICGIATLCVLGPVGYVVSNALAAVINGLSTLAPWLVPTIVGVFLPFLVMTGTHHALTPIGINNRMTIGFDTIIYPGQLASNVAQGAAALAVSIKTKDPELKQLTSATGITAVCGITEVGGRGATLLLDHWFSLSHAVSGFVLNLLCYGWGWRLLGRSFIAYSLIATVGFSLPYKLYELFPPLWPQLAEMPLLAAVVGALFVGVGAGLSVRAGGASGGDDALAMCIAHVTGMGIQWAYLSTDLVVLGLSLTYIPLRRIGYSLLTVLISGQLIGLVQRLPLPWDRAQPETME